MNYANLVSNFNAMGNNNKPLAWNKANNKTWIVNANKQDSIILNYDVLPTALLWQQVLSIQHVYLTLAATFLYIDKAINSPVSLTI